MVLSASVASAGEDTRRLDVQDTVRVRLLPEGGARLTFEPGTPAPAPKPLRREELRGVLLPPPAHPMEWDEGERASLAERYGTPPLSLPASLETSPLYRALQLTPRHLGTGVREAAEELFHSPAFVTSVSLSVLMYFAAWLAPEPLFTKAFVTALTLRLTLAVGAVELTRVARACVRLYQEAQVARSQQELEAAAEHFGTALGSSGLRLLVLVASLGVGRVAPSAPEGGAWTLLGPPRFALPNGLSLSNATAVQMAADGSVLVMGAAVGIAAASPCADGSIPKAGHQWHHLATNKNEVSTARGGPWTPLFEELFSWAQMSLDAVENRIYLQGHQGPHSEQYHREVYDRLRRSMEKCGPVSSCRDKLTAALRKLADEACTPGSRLHQFLTSPSH